MSTVLYFSADWCGPCKAMKPIIEEFEQNNLEPAVIKIDVDEDFTIAQEYNVSGIPTFILLSALGEELKRKRGPMNKVNFEEFALGE